MYIVVLDGHGLNPGDLSWDWLRALGPCVVYDRTPASEIVARAQDAEIVLTNKTRLGAAELERLARLRYIGVLATGFDVVDVNAAFERGVVVANVPAYGTPSVAQMTFALLLELCNQVGHHAEAARHGRWSQSGEFSYRELPLHELAGLTFGIVGLGRIGRAVAAIAAAFEMNVIAASSASGAGEGAPERVALDELFARADVVSLHCPLAPSTARMVNAARLARMKPNAFLINTARGGLIDEAALLDALVQGRIGGAGLDVLTVEPPAPDHPLLSAPRCIVTPHMAWATHASRERLLSVAVDNVRAFIAGTPLNVVSGPRPA